MMDAEMAFTTHKENLEIQEQLIYHIVQTVLEKNAKELAILEKDVEKLKKVQIPFIRKDYVDVIKELQ
jgi:asparaginyl-tRNA synthetase